MLYSRIVYVVVVILVFSRSCDGEDTAPASDAQIPTEEMPSLRVGAAHKSTESPDDTRLVDAFLDASFMARLSKNLVPLCAEKADETNVAQSGLSCKQVNYLGEVQQYRRMFKPKADKEDIVRKAPVVVDRTVVDAAAPTKGEAPKLQYADLFEDYIVKRVAFKGTMEKKSEASFKPPGCDGATVHPITLDKPLRDCAAYASAGDGDGKFSVDKSVFVPTIAANSYFHRLPGHEVLGQYADSSSVNTLGLDFASHWPALLDVGSYQSEGGEAGASPVHSCPLGAHMVMWNPGARAVDVQLIHATDSPKFGPKLGDSGSGGKDKDASYLHYPRFSASGFGGLPDRVNPATVSLAHNEYLFAPNTVLVSVRKGEGEGDGEGGALMRSCFVDASNLNTFREALAGPAFLHEYGAAVEQIVNQAGFNASMDAAPTDMSLRELRDAIAMQVAKLSAATAGVEGGDANSPEQQQTEDGAAADDANSSGGARASGKRGRERSGGGGGRDRRDRRSRNTNVKGFIDSAKWRVLVEGLTVPPANTPVTHSITFRAATIEWTSAFLPRKAEDAKFAFIITLCKYNPDSDDEDGEDNSNDCTVLTEEPGSKALKSRVEGRVTAEDEGTTYFSHRFLKLEPGTQYFARVAYFYGENYPKPSPWVGITTPILAPPLPLPELPFIEMPNSGCTSVTLSVPSVEEEGGSSTSGYYVFARFLGPQHVKGMHAKKRNTHSLTEHATDWYFHERVQISSSNIRQTNKGKDVVDVLYNDIVIDGLVPNNMYEFKVTPYNEIGKSDSLSHSTEVIGINCDGRKTPEAVVYASVYSLDDVDAGPLLTINDAAQTLSCSDSEHSTLNVWGAHWNPKSFRVVGKTTHVKPIMLENDVFNPKEIAHTIAIVSRGAIPLVHKILKLQAAGAKGVIILDTGECKEYDHHCVAGSDKKRGDGWASEDMPEAWSLVRIPSMLIKRGDERFLGKCLGHPTYKPNDLKNEL